MSTPGSVVDMISRIEHTLLKPDATAAEIKKLCAEAEQFGFHGVCVNTSFIPLVKSQLKKARIIAVVGFPLGACTTEVKMLETQGAISNGADEIDMVIPLGYLKDKNIAYVENDIQTVVRAARGKPVKVIIETALLTDPQKILACQIAERAGAHYVKTCTGFAGGGATVEDIKLMRQTCTRKVGIKASGGIKTREQALALVLAGADRLGTSSGVALAEGAAADKGSY